MPLWTRFINTRIEVDDDDLPLAKHRIYDDEGKLKPFPQVQGRRSLEAVQTHASSAKKTSAIPVKQANTKAAVTGSSQPRSPSKSPSPTAHSPTIPRAARSNALSRHSDSVSQPPAPRPSAATPAKKTARKSPAAKKKSSTPSSRKSTPTPSSSQKKDGGAMAAWSVVMLRGYAMENNINVTGLRKKEELLKAVQKASGRLSAMA